MKFIRFELGKSENLIKKEKVEQLGLLHERLLEQSLGLLIKIVLQKY